MYVSRPWSGGALTSNCLHGHLCPRKCLCGRGRSTPPAGCCGPLKPLSPVPAVDRTVATWSWTPADHLGPSVQSSPGEGSGTALVWAALSQTLCASGLRQLAGARMMLRWVGHSRPSGRLWEHRAAPPGLQEWLSCEVLPTHFRPLLTLSGRFLHPPVHLPLCPLIQLPTQPSIRLSSHLSICPSTPLPLPEDLVASLRGPPLSPGTSRCLHLGAGPEPLPGCPCLLKLTWPPCHGLGPKTPRLVFA